MSVEFLIGADPELFVRDRDGNLVSAYGMIPGTKSDPFEVEGGAVQVDGMALEFNINPAKTADEFNNNIVNVLRQLKEMIPAGYEFDFSPVAEFGKDYIQSQPEEARELGCDPDFNAYTGKANPKPNVDYPFRTASGHIHIGWTSAQDINVQEHIEACHMAVKQLDCILGLPSRRWDKDRTRATMYGKFGAYRPKHYGVEYRTLSNTWVNHEDRRRFVFNAAQSSMKELVTGVRIYDNYYIPDFDRYIEVGNFSDISYYARQILKSRESIYQDWLNINEVATANPFDKKEEITTNHPIWNIQPLAHPLADVAFEPINDPFEDEAIEEFLDDGDFDDLAELEA